MGTDPLVRLPVTGFGDSIVSVPLGTRVRRPILLAAHGNYDRPEWQCAMWRHTLEKAGLHAFVLCPRGFERSDSPSADDIRFTYANGASLTKELDLGLAALRAKYADFVFPEDDGAVVYTGFSLGAMIGVSYITRNPARTPRAVLTEGSQAEWTSAAVYAFAKRGGVRVLFACGQPSCVTMSNSVATVMKKAGIDSRVVHGKGVGHGYDGPVADEIGTQLPWLLEGDPRWGP